MSGNTEKRGFFKSLFSHKSSCCSSFQYDEIRVEIFEADHTELPDVSEELLQKNIGIKRYSYSSEPEIFESNPQIKELLSSKGESALPLTLIDGKIKKTGTPPAKNEILNWLGIAENQKCGCGGSGCC